MPDYEPLDYRLRCHSKRTDLPPDVLRVICEAYVRLLNLEEERNEARRDLCDLYVKGQPSASNMTDKDYAAELGWDCFEQPKTNEQKAMDRLAQLDEEMGLN